MYKFLLENYILWSFEGQKKNTRNTYIWVKILLDIVVK